MKYRCHKCGNDSIFEVKQRATGYSTTLYSKNFEVDNSEMYTGITLKPLKFMYCNQCGAKQKFTLKDFENNLNHN